MDIVEQDFHRIAIVTINILILWQVIIVSVNRKTVETFKAFMMMSVSLILWVNLAFLARTVDNPELSGYLLRLGWTASLPFSLAIYYFTTKLTGTTQRYKYLTIIYTLLTVILGVVTLFSGLVVDSIRNTGFGLGINYGIGMFPYLGLVLLLITSTGFILIKEFPKASDAVKKQLRPFIIGLVAFYSLNIIFNVTLPIVFDITRLYYFGDYSTIIVLILISYSIVRHKFLGAKVALSSLLVSVIGVFQIIDIVFFASDDTEQIIKALVFILYLFVAYLLILTTVNETKQKEELERVNKKLDKSRQRYFELAAEQKDIIDVMGHEIRTPLTAITQEVELQKGVVIPEWDQLVAGKLDQTKREKYLGLIKEAIETIDRASSHAISLVGDMLETARLDKKRFTLNYEEFDLVGLIDETIQLMQKTVTHEAEIKFNTRNKKLLVNADKTRIKEAVMALINNSLKYSDENKDKIAIEVKLAEKEGNVEIVIADNGIGIAKEDIAKLGKKFVRLEPKLNGNLKRPGGTGLGLYVVNGIMQHHKGKLQIESAGVGKGSTFKLIFPNG